MKNQNIENNAQKDTYDKLVTGAGVDLFSEDGFDEMQKVKNYEIGFKLFRIFYLIMFIASMAVMLTACGFENTVFTIIGYALMVLCTLFYFLWLSHKLSQKILKNGEKNDIIKKERVR